MGAPVKTGKALAYKSKDCLTEKQRRWVEEYLKNGKNGPLAYARVYAQNWKEGDPLTNNHKVTAGRRMLRNPKILKVLAEAEEKVHAVTVKVMERFAVTEERVLTELARIAFSNHTDAVSWDDETGIQTKNSADLDDNTKSAIVEVTETENKAGKKKIKIKMADKAVALQTLAKHLGLLKEQHEHKHLVAAKLIIEG